MITNLGGYPIQNKLTKYMALAVFSLGISQPAFACKFAPLQTAEARADAAKTTVSNASVIIDAVVIRPYKSEAEPALLKARTFLKGPKGKQLFLVGGATSCDNQFTQKGERKRVLLFGGPKLYRASMYASASEDIDRAIAALPRRKR